MVVAAAAAGGGVAVVVSPPAAAETPRRRVCSRPNYAQKNLIVAGGEHRWCVKKCKQKKRPGFFCADRAAPRTHPCDVALAEVGQLRPTHHLEAVRLKDVSNQRVDVVLESRSVDAVEH